MRTALMAIPVALLMVAAGGALSQTPSRLPGNPPKVTYPDGRTYPQAPVGHRQPSLGDLPPDLARRQRLDELPPADRTDGAGARDRDIDPQLRICRGC